MNTQKLIQDAKARFKHSESKIYLTEKYKNRLTFAHSGGMWTSTPELIGFLATTKGQIVLLDDFGNPVRVDATELEAAARSQYVRIMDEWFNEYDQLSSLR